ncbi:MAG: nuclease [Cyanobacteria bacterium QS_8_64_29]|nr:MAG: nuclease [Cyanobacteria bacterium QS_8_64_29]
MHRDRGEIRCAPTDLLRFLGCRHASYLDWHALDGGLRPDDPDPQSAFIQQQGRDHEWAYLDKVRVQYSLVEIAASGGVAERAARTQQAMRAGTPAIAQAVLERGPWQGMPDLLWRIEQPSALGAHAYEPGDIKLASHPQPEHLLQLAAYADLLASEQGTLPQRLHLVLGDERHLVYRCAEFWNFYTRVRDRFEAFLAQLPQAAQPSQPEPCPMCDQCDWHSHCEAVWEQQDHLTHVADIRQSQIAKLRAAGVTTVAQLAALPEEATVRGMSAGTLARLRRQAALQCHQRKTGQDTYQLLEVAPGQGLERLPPPDPGDLFFDIEGDPFYPGGLEYLFGVYQTLEPPEFRCFWAHDRDQERQALEQTIDCLVARLQQRPHAHIYHYAHYEFSALKRLSSAHGTREAELDQLLRERKFVDLYRVVREGLAVSRPSYSLKELEAFYTDKRSDAVETAVDSILWYEHWRQSRDDTKLRDIADYNQVDCRSTGQLRDWLLSLRPEPPPAQAAEAQEPPAVIAAVPTESDTLAQAVSTGATHLPERARTLIGHLLEFHRREEKPQWWALFERANSLEEDLIDDPECLAGLVWDADCPLAAHQRSVLVTYRYPAQETKLAPGDRPAIAANLNATHAIAALNETERRVQLKRGKTSDPLPERLSLIPGRPIQTQTLKAAVGRLAQSAAARAGRYAAVEAFLARAAPRIAGCDPQQPLVAPGSDPVAAVRDLALGLQASYLVVQGPPGTGKTHTAARAIVALLQRGDRVGVMAATHKAINNLLAKVEAAARAEGLSFCGAQKASSDRQALNREQIATVREPKKIGTEHQLIAGTAWLFARPEFDLSCDALFVDEAGQVSLGNLVAAGTAGRNLVLVGDRMQLGQPIQGTHPGEAGQSSLDYLLGERATIPPERGVFLDTTRRLPPEICCFVSSAIYEGRLQAHPDTATRHLVLPPDAPAALAPRGLRFVDAHHSGCQQKSEAEADIIKGLIDCLLTARVCHADGSQRPLTLNDILVTAPYNLQVSHLERVLPDGAQVGTVDRFQGQEAEVVLVSMTTSSPQELPRQVEFLYSRNRLNVAISRARCLAVTIANPALLDLPCTTVEQIRPVNTLCWLRDYARAH